MAPFSLASAGESLAVRVNNAVTPSGFFAKPPPTPQRANRLFPFQRRAGCRLSPLATLPPLSTLCCLFFFFEKSPPRPVRRVFPGIFFGDIRGSHRDGKFPLALCSVQRR